MRFKKIAHTEKSATFIKTLRESLCLPTTRMDIRCDSAAAFVLATGEGSWRTKSAANKVYGVRGQVDFGTLKVTCVNIVNQCADSLAKFSKGGQEQRRAREQLSLSDVNQWQPGERFKLWRPVARKTVGGVLPNLSGVGSVGFPSRVWSSFLLSGRSLVREGKKIKPHVKFVKFATCSNFGPSF